MKRILLKLSGEALAGAAKRGFDEETVIAVAKQIRTIAEEGTQVGVVIGGGKRPYQRDNQPQQSGSDWNACYGYELYLCF